MIDIIPFHGWKNNLRLSNGSAELIATLDVGPRILSYAMPGRPSPLNVYADQAGGTGEQVWRNRGGHRLWIAPEEQKTTYHPDNSPVAWEKLSDLRVRLTPPPETPVGIQKQIEIELAPTGTQVTLTHRITRLATAAADATAPAPVAQTAKSADEAQPRPLQNPKSKIENPLTLAPWALTVMRAGGTAIIPQPPFGEHPRDLLPNRNWVLWPYTDLGDPRWTFTPEFVFLRQDTNPALKPTKLGMALETGAGAYLCEGALFIKHFPFLPAAAAAYPDKGCNFETFTNARMLELESLAPLVTLQPGQTTEHIEHWQLREGPAADIAASPRALREWLLAERIFMY